MVKPYFFKWIVFPGVKSRYVEVKVNLKLAEIRQDVYIDLLKRR